MDVDNDQDKQSADNARMSTYSLAKEVQDTLRNYRKNSAQPVRKS